MVTILSMAIFEVGLLALRACFDILSQETYEA